MEPHASPLHPLRPAPARIARNLADSATLTVSLMLGLRFPMFVAFGPDLGFLYNGPTPKESTVIGGRFQDIWAEIWPAAAIDRALSGEATWSENMPLTMNRHWPAKWVPRSSLLTLPPRVTKANRWACSAAHRDHRARASRGGSRCQAPRLRFLDLLGKEIRQERTILAIPHGCEHRYLELRICGHDPDEDALYIRGDWLRRLSEHCLPREPLTPKRAVYDVASLKLLTTNLKSATRGGCNLPGHRHRRNDLHAAR